MAEQNPHIESAEDKEYRSKSTSHMFRSILYGALAQATFLGLLGSLVVKVLGEFSTKAVTEIATTGAENVAGFLGVTPLGWGIMGVMMAAGVAFTYMSQVESVKLREVQDEGLRL